MPITSRQQRMLLAALLRAPGEVASRDRLIDVIWGDHPPATAAKALQVHVSQLRKALGAAGRERLVTRPAGYALDVAEGEVDGQTFERLVEEGRAALRRGDAARAARALSSGLALWRGPPLGDLAYEEFARGEVERLQELRLVAIEARLEAELELGTAGLEAELEALVATHPLRERPRELLMTAHYRAGRQADALRVYAEGRRALVDELGIEPGPRLRALHESILRQDPELDAPPRAAEPPPADSDFVGREAELQELTGALEGALGRRGALVLISGEPGAGKSRLAGRVEEAAGRRGALVLSGRCWEAGGAPAYWPWVEVLRSLVLADDLDAIRERAIETAPELGWLVPEIGGAEAAGTPPAESESDRFRLFDAVARFLRAAAETKPLVLVLDDLHAADTPSLLLLEFLAGRLDGARLLIVGTYRDTEVGPERRIATTLPELARDRAVRRIRLAGLSEPEIERYIVLAAGPEAPRSAARLILAETEGNPLFVGETVRLLVAEGRLDEAASAERWDFGVPDELRGVVGRRLDRLDLSTRELLGVAAVLGREFRLDALEMAGELPRERVLDAIERAAAPRIVEPVPGAPGTRRFSHAVIRDVVYDELSPAQLRNLHTRAARALESLHGEDAGAQSAELAHHYRRAAAAGGEAAIAVEWSRRAAERAAEILAFEEAGRLYELALQAHGAGDRALRCELLLALGDMRSRAGDVPNARDSFRRAAELARAEGLPDQLARAALGYGGRFVWTRRTADPELVPLLDAALGALGEREDPLRVHLLARLAAALRPGSERPGSDTGSAPPEAVALADRAVAIARSLDDPRALAVALDGRVHADCRAGNAAKRVRMADEIVALSEAADDPEQAFAGHDHALFAHWELGDPIGVARELAALERLAERLRQPAQLWGLASAQGILATSQGRFADAEAAAARALEHGREAQPWNAPISHQLQVFALRRAQGRLADVRAPLEASVQEFPDYAMLRCALVLLHVELEEHDLARRGFAALADGRFAGVHRGESWLLETSLLAEACARLADRRSAAVLYDMVSPYADLVAVGAPDTSADAAARYLGLLAEILGRADAAIGHLRSAVELNSRMGARAAAADSRADLARVLLARDGPGDRHEARELIEAADAAYALLGMPRSAARAADPASSS